MEALCQFPVESCVCLRRSSAFLTTFGRTWP